eukprot:gene1500-259_t
MASGDYKYLHDPTLLNRMQVRAPGESSFVRLRAPGESSKNSKQQINELNNMASGDYK